LNRVKVTDASVVLSWVLPDPAHGAALELLKRSLQGELILIAPRIVMDEAASALAKRCHRKQLSAAQATAAFQYLTVRRPALNEDPFVLTNALDLSLRYGLSLWDCQYLALAIHYRADLVTADRRLARAAAQHYPYVDLLK
jgi:predicted nucleic acid-binding protein